jgi:formylmethanofuran dehydrogenase subunit E
MDIKEKETEEEVIEDVYACDICGEEVEELIDTEGMVNGGIGTICPDCAENGDVGR